MSPSTSADRANRAKLWWLLTADSLALLLVVYLLVRTTGLIGVQRDLSTPEVVLIGILIVLFAAFANSYALSEFSIGPGGVKASLVQMKEVQEHIREDQNHMKGDIEALRVAITGLLTNYERAHLKNLSDMASYHVRYLDSMYAELDKLLKIGYVEEVQPGALDSMKKNHEGSEAEYNLNQYLAVTTLGAQYLAIHAKYAGEEKARSPLP